MDFVKVQKGSDSKCLIILLKKDSDGLYLYFISSY